MSGMDKEELNLSYYIRFVFTGTRRLQEVSMEGMWSRSCTVAVEYAQVTKMLKYDFSSNNVAVIDRDDVKTSPEQCVTPIPAESCQHEQLQTRKRLKMSLTQFSNEVHSLMHSGNLQPGSRFYCSSSPVVKPRDFDEEHQTSDDDDGAAAFLSETLDDFLSGEVEGGITLNYSTDLSSTDRVNILYPIIWEAKAQHDSGTFSDVVITPGYLSTPQHAYCILYAFLNPNRYEMVADPAKAKEGLTQLFSKGRQRQRKILCVLDQVDVLVRSDVVFVSFLLLSCSARRKRRSSFFFYGVGLHQAW